MNSYLSRELLTHLVIAIGIVAAAHVMLIQPQRTRLAELERRIETLQADVATPDQSRQIPEDLLVEADSVRALANEVRERNKVAEDVAQLYDQLYQLAVDHELELGPFTPRHLPGETDEPDVLSLRIIATGRYDDVATFLNALRDLPGFCRTTSVTVRPIGDAPDALVRATISTGFLTFELPKSLAMLSEDRDAQL
ncbi:MAG: hypothetical protein KAS72_01550 [Phycisphaerales bacterium]|nr:hypothetical protein [Phycisphaerales bacterium]